MLQNKLQSLIPTQPKLTGQTRIMDSIRFNNSFYNIFFLYKIDTYKIKNQPNIEVIEKQNQTETNYIV
jgi:hypothetical protein